MIKTILGYLFILSFILFYIYYGIRLIENFKTKTEIIIYLISYVLLGITIMNLMLVSKYWEVLSQKRGPPGPRGLMGEIGEEGHTGACSLDHNVMFALIKIKSGIADAITKIDNERKIEDIYNEKENTLVNNTLDTIVNRIVQSKEFDTILLRPEQNETMKYGKSLKDIVGYLKSIISGWATDIYKLEGGQDFMTKIDGSFSDTPEIENYYHTEIEKYDIWYWGGTRVFKPLEIMVMRQTEFTDNNGKKQQNSAFPQDDLPPLGFIEVEYSDYDTSQLEWLWDSNGIRDAEPNLDKWKNAYNSSEGTYGKFIHPAIYIPKMRVIGNTKYYPLGCVMIEKDEPNKSSTIRKTLLVTGDVIIPDRYTLMWKDRKRKFAGSLLNKAPKDTSATDGDRAGVFWRVETSNTEYITLGDYFWGISSGGNGEKENFTNDINKNLEMLKGKINYSNINNYKGIVAIPKKYAIQIAQNELPDWSYRFYSTDRYYSNFTVDVFSASNNNYNLLRAKDGKHHKTLLTNGPDSSTGGQIYKINMQALKHLHNPLKDTEPENNDLGFGYYGYPYLITDKYSIFKFLNLVPEGLIINYNNNRKLYIRHYGGADINRYNIFKYDSKTGRYDKALRVNGPTNVRFSRMKPNDPRFAFSYEVDKTDSRFIRFKSISNPNDGYLKYISQITNTNLDKGKGQHPGGISIDHTNSIFTLEQGAGDTTNKNKKLFMFLQAHGRGLAEVQVPRLDLKSMSHPGAKKTYT